MNVTITPGIRVALDAGEEIWIETKYGVLVLRSEECRDAHKLVPAGIFNGKQMYWETGK